MLAGHLDQAVRVGGVGGADHQHQVALARQLLDGDLAVGGRVTDVVRLRAGDLGELRPQASDDLQRLVDRQRRLGDVGDLVGVRDLEVVHVLGGLHQHDAGRRLAGRPLHLLVARVADQHDRVALLGELARLDVDLGDQRTGGVDRAQAPPVARSRGPSGRRRVRRRRPARPPGPRSPRRRRSRPARRAARRRACCGRSPCARRPAARAAPGPPRPSARLGRRRRSSRAARPAARAAGRRGQGLGGRKPWR